MSKYNLSTIVVLLGIGLVLYAIGNCSGRSHAGQNQAIDSFRVATRYSDSVEQEWTAEVIQLKRKASADSASAAYWRGAAQSAAREAATVRPPPSDPIPLDSLPEAYNRLSDAYDTLQVAYGLMVRLDSLNVATIAAKDSIIQRDSVQIAALQRVRASAIRAVASQRCTIIFGIGCPSRSTVGLVALGAGVILGYELARH